MSDRLSVSPSALETLEGRVLFSASTLLDALDVTPAAGPEITVRRGAQNINDGQAELVFFPATPQGQTASSAQFVITNNGTSNLTLGTVSVPSGYQIVTTPAASVAPGESTILRVRLITTTAGTFNGQISIVTNDTDENPFNFPVRGRVIASAAPPDIDVFAGDPKVEAGDTVPVNFGQVAVGGSKSFTFRVRNDGGGTLNIQSLTVPAGFSVTNNLSSSLQSGEQDTFTVSVNTATAGVKSGNIVIKTNDPDGPEATFTFAISATVGGSSTILPDAFEGATGDNTANLSRFHFNNDRYRFHTIHNTGDVDWVRFYVPQTSYVAVRAVHGGAGGVGDVRMRLYGPKATNNADGIGLTAPAWNASAVPQNDRPQDTILVRAGLRALTTGWYWLSVDGMGGTVAEYGIRVYVRPLAAADAAVVEAHQGVTPSAAAAAFASSSSTTKADKDDAGSEDTLTDAEPVYSFLA